MVTWRAQHSWAAGGLVMPQCKLTEPLPVDLAFRVDLLTLDNGEIYEAGCLILQRGETRPGAYFSTHPAAKFAEGRHGKIPLRVILRPSPALALSFPKIENYYSRTIISDIVEAEVLTGEEVQERQRVPPGYVKQ